ncbi:MAG: hypothetical protein JWQ86_3268 [Mycobacterium sp.]|nr:hypothetical protein [Mycobacterium sp.]MDT5213397.1 hypothetical protein [Mycobacterium sp.]
MVNVQHQPVSDPTKWRCGRRVASPEVGFQKGENANDQGLLATGMHAVNAIPWVCDAEPGIVDALHMPLTSPLGALRPRRDGIRAF